MRHLKHLRAAIAVAVLAPAALAFLDFGRLLPAPVAPFVARLQLLPALLRLPAAGAIATIAAVLAATLVLGRVYCSTVCPLGTLQDLFIRLGHRLHRRRRFRFGPFAPRRRWHLALGGAAIAAAAAGSLAALGLLEPWSAFGRILSAAVRPPLAAAVNALARALAEARVYALPPVVPPGPAPAAALVALGSLAAIAALSLWRGRLFCNLLCPAGAMLRLAAQRTVLRISLDEQACNGCGVCEKVCKAGCIDAAARRVAFDACVGCFDCLDVCPRGGVRYGLPFALSVAPRSGAESKGEMDPTRRALLRAATLAPAALLAPAAGHAAHEVDPRDARAPITPPGSRARSHFTDHCTACHLCVAACPTQVLRPSLLAYGAAGLLQPRLVYDAGACVFDCRRCAEVCPTGAIEELPLAEKRLVQVGRARFVKADCVVETKKKACGACAEHCPTKAIQMVPYAAPGGEPGLRIPEVDEDACVGCGACEHPCPVTPRKAIWVEACEVHGVAKKLERRALEAPPATTDEFPF